MITLDTSKVHVGQGTCEGCGKEKASKSSTVAPHLYQLTREGQPVGKKLCGMCHDKITKLNAQVQRGMIPQDEYEGRMKLIVG